MSNPGSNKIEIPLSNETQTPRAPKTTQHQAQITVQNRRREYLARTPSYFSNVEHELADPVLYERLVKRHQSHAERESEGRAKGYGRTLEADLIRGETKLSNISPANKNKNTAATGDETWDQDAENKNHGLELWREFLTDRFVKGDDDEFDYTKVDSRDELDTLQRAEEEEQWYDEEEPSWHEDLRDRHGETGIQDF